MGENMVCNLSIYDKEQCVLRHQNGTPLKTLEAEYHVSRVTIYRWTKQYDGTISSLEPKLSRKSIKHPKAMSLDEEKKLLKIVQQNPNITNRELSALLGTNRNPAFLHRKREKLLEKREIAHKNDYKTLFNNDKLSQINENDYYKQIIPEKFFVIEITNNLYLAKRVSRSPISITPYFSMCLQFPSPQSASAFLESLGEIKVEYTPKIRRIEKGILQL